MHADLIAVPVGIALAVLAADAALPSEWGAVAGPIGAATSIIYVVKVFLADRTKTAEESTKATAVLVEANRLHNLSMLESNERNNVRFAEALSAMTLEISGVRKDVAIVIDRNDRKDHNS